MSDSPGGIDVSGSLDVSLESQLQVKRFHDVMPSNFYPINIPRLLLWGGGFPLELLWGFKGVPLVVPIG
jgi:hypothetical protein